MEWVSVNAVGYSGNQQLRMVKYHWQTEGIKFIIITKQIFTEPSQDVTLEVSIKLAWHDLVSPLFSPKTAWNCCTSPYCFSPCTKRNQKQTSVSSITSFLMYVYPLYCMFHNVCLPFYHMCPQCSLSSTTCSLNIICPANTFP